MRTVVMMNLLLVSALGQTGRPEVRDWTLPSSSPVRRGGPQTWRFTCDYHYLDTKGNLERRQRVSGLYTRGLPGDTVRWSDVTVADAAGAFGEFGAPQKRGFMEGFSYAHSIGKDALKPDFFRGFPPLAFEERNLVWDTQMIESFGQTQFAHLKLNQPYHFPDAADIPLGGLGSFHHKDLELIWTGLSKRNGQECALVDYRALFNRVELKNPAMTLVGRSDYWGQIWVSLPTKDIEHATLYENVLGELQTQQQAPRIVTVFRVGTFEPVVK